MDKVSIFFSSWSLHIVAHPKGVNNIETAVQKVQKILRVIEYMDYIATKVHICAACLVNGRERDEYYKAGTSKKYGATVSLKFHRVAYEEHGRKFTRINIMIVQRLLVKNMTYVNEFNNQERHFAAPIVVINHLHYSFY